MLKKKYVAFVLIAVAFLLFSCGKKGGSTPDIVIPALKIENASQARMVTDNNMHFQLTLSKTTTVPVSVDYTVIDGTALALKDYVAASGTVTIEANKAIGELNVVIKGDPSNTRQNNLTFKVQLTNPKNCTIRYSKCNRYYHYRRRNQPFN